MAALESPSRLFIVGVGRVANSLTSLKGEGPGARKEFHYISDDGDYAAFRCAP